jgi:tRNA dimethylallyltransferase
MAVNLLVILGPTASGKTRLAVELARRNSGEIISADSRQVFRRMDIGTGKDLDEYGEVPYHLIDIIDPGLEFNVFEFQHRFYYAFSEISNRGHLPVLVGGTGLYLESVLLGYQLPAVPENPDLRRELATLGMADLEQRLRRATDTLHNTTDLLDRTRLVRAIEIAEHQTGTIPDHPRLEPLVFGIRWDRHLLRQRITARLNERLAQGMIEEVAKLHESGVTWEALDYYGLEYRFIAHYLQGELSHNDMYQKLNSAIHDFAKRQENWFRRMERKGIIIHWLNGAGDPIAEAQELLHALA